jgi:type IV secretion system protein VirB4
MMNLKIYRDKPKSLGDILNFAAMIDSSTLLNKDGSLTTGYNYFTSDLSSAPLFERNALTNRMNRVLSQFGTNWTIHIDSFRTKINNYPKKEESYFKDPITLQIDENRREYFLNQGNLYETQFTLFLTYIPPSKVKSTLLSMSGDSKESKFETHIKYFKEKLSEFENIFTSFFKIERLENHLQEDSDKNQTINSPILSMLNHYITGRKHPINLPPVPMYLDSVIGAKPLVGGLEPKIGDKYIKIVAIDGFPMESSPNILNTLNLMDFEYRFSNRFIYLDQSEALSLLDKERRKWNQQTTSLWQQLLNVQTNKVDKHATEMVNQIDSATADQKSNMVSFGYYIANIVILDENQEQLHKKANLVIQNIESLGFGARVENFNTIEAWLGTLPSHSIQNLRKQMISTLNLSHFIPTSNIWTGDRYCPSDKFPRKSPPLLHTVSDGNVPFRLNLHVEDVGHTLIFGPTGAGKSTLIALLIAQFHRYRDAKIFAFDKGNSLFALTKATGGKHYEILKEDEELSFAPLANIKTTADRVWAEDWIEMICELQGQKVMPEQKRKIREALNTHIETNSKTLTEFIAQIQDDDISEALSFYSSKGSLDILDGDEDSITFTTLSTFELHELMQLGDKVVIPILLYLFHKIEQSLDGSPSAIFIDEAWVVLGHPVFRDKIKEWLKVLRKYNCAVILSTQSLSDATNSGILDVLQESCPTKIFLPNSKAFQKGGDSTILGPYDFYRVFGLNDQEIEIIYSAIPKREYYYSSPNGTRKFNLVFDDYSLAFCGASSIEEVTQIKKLIKEDESTWISKWTQYRTN